MQREQQRQRELGGSANMLAGMTLASRTAGKRVFKPRPIPLSAEIPGRSRLSGKGFAQMASITRTANEDPHSLSRGNTDFHRTGAKRIHGHGGVMTRMAQGRRDSRDRAPDR